MTRSLPTRVLAALALASVVAACGPKTPLEATFARRSPLLADGVDRLEFRADGTVSMSTTNRKGEVEWSFDGSYTFDGEQGTVTVRNQKSTIALEGDSLRMTPLDPPGKWDWTWVRED